VAKVRKSVSQKNLAQLNQKSLSAGVLRLLVRYAITLHADKPAGTNSTPALCKLRAVRRYGFAEVIGENVAQAWQSTSEQW
jgi:hypothetical protein